MVITVDGATPQLAEMTFDGGPIGQYRYPLLRWHYDLILLEARPTPPHTTETMTVQATRVFGPPDTCAGMRIDFVCGQFGLSGTYTTHTYIGPTRAAVGFQRTLT